MKKNSTKISSITAIALILLVTASVSLAETMKVRVIKDANVRLKPTTESQVIATLTAGTILESLGKFNAWFKINLPPDDQGVILTGYIWEELVEAVVEQAAPQPSVTTPPPPVASIPPQPANQQRGGAGLSFGIKLSGGMSYLSMSDPNSHLQGWTDFFEDLDSATPFINVSGGFDTIHWGLNFEGDIIILFNDSFGIGFGAGYIQGKHGIDNEITITSPFGGATITEEMIVTAIPLRLSLYLFLPITSGAEVFFNAGGGYYIAKWTDNRREENGFWYTADSEATSGGFGFHGGLGLLIELNPNIAITIEGTGRYAKITGFEGTLIEEDEGGWSSTETGPLWLLNVTGPTQDFDHLLINDTEPAGMGVNSAREAAMDFSGFAAKIGFLIRF